MSPANPVLLEAPDFMGPEEQCSPALLTARPGGKSRLTGVGVSSEEGGMDSPCTEPHITRGGTPMAPRPPGHVLLSACSLPPGLTSPLALLGLQTPSSS